MRLDNIKLIRVTYADLIGSSSVSRAQIINTMQPTVPTRAKRAPRLGNRKQNNVLTLEASQVGRSLKFRSEFRECISKHSRIRLLSHNLIQVT